jgi:NAD(P)-dependent dehydrogenase (short-subunit alcohol dehydrogenase family)
MIHDKTVDATAALHRAVQQQQDRHDSATPSAPVDDTRPVQTGARSYPGLPLPSQHLDKPGMEADMTLKPQFMAPDYRGSGKLDGMVAIITGGDSGIGRAVAVLYAREGADVAIIYLNEHQDASDTQRHVEAEGQTCLRIAGDVRDAGFCQRAVEQVHAQFGQIDILVNNAGFQEHADSLLDITEERFDLTMKTNVYGYFHMAKAVLPHLKRGAAIINTGSITGLLGNKNLLDYSTTKGAIHAFTMALASNLLPQGIRVNAIAPGPVWTPLNPADQTPENIARFGDTTDMHRPAQPEELSPAYVFLASAVCSSYITGIVLPVTGSVGE